MDRTQIGQVGRVPISLGFLLNLLVTLVTVVIAFASLRNDTFIALKEITKQETILIEQQKTIMEMRMAIQRIVDESEYFHKQYNEDMNRYIREKVK